MDATLLFFEAIEAGDFEQVRELLVQKPDLLSSRNSDGLSAVLLASYHQNDDVLDELARTGACTRPVRGLRCRGYRSCPSPARRESGANRSICGGRIYAPRIGRVLRSSGDAGASG